MRAGDIMAPSPQSPAPRPRRRLLTIVGVLLLVTGLAFQDGFLHLELLGHQGQPGTNPREILEKVLGMDVHAALLARIMKTEVRECTSPS